MTKFSKNHKGGFRDKEKLTTDDDDDDRRQVMTKAHMTFQAIRAKKLWDVVVKVSAP